MGGRAGVAEVLAREHGVFDVARQPRLAATARRLVRAGELQRLFPGIFTLPQPSFVVRLAAATAAVPDGVICGPTAWALHSGTESSHVHVASPTYHHRLPGIRLHSRLIPAECQISAAGIRAATIAHACLDMAATDGGSALCVALQRGGIRRGDLENARAALAVHRAPRRIERLADAALTNPWSVAEMVLHDLLRRAGISGWVANTRLVIRGLAVFPDVLFDEQRVVLEVDGWAEHGTRAAFQADRDRQNLLIQAGYLVQRFTWQDLTDRPDKVVLAVRATLVLRR